MASRGDELHVPDLPESVAAVLGRLIAAGHEVALVGGSIRDRLRGRPVAPEDWDAASSARPEQMAALFGDGAAWENRFGTVTIAGGPIVEVTAYRSEFGYGDRRRPDEVRFGVTLDEDLERRDFTINAIAWLPTDLDRRMGRLVDPHGGRDDLRRGVLRTVGDPTARFGEDALRLVRAARFAGRLGLEIEPATSAAIRDLAPTVAEVSGERIGAEIRRILQSDAPPARDAPPSRALMLMEELGLLAVLFPEVAALRGVPQDKPSGGDALDHTFAAVDAASPEQPAVRLAALLHDIGKATTAGGGHFYRHEIVGADVAAIVLRRLRVPSAEGRRVVHAIRQHMYAYDDSWTDAAVRRFVRRVGTEALPMLFALRRADNDASGVGEAGEVNQLALERRIETELRTHGQIEPATLAIDGHELQRGLGIGPGPEVGRLLDALLEAVLDDPARNEPEELMRLARDLHRSR